MKDRIRVLIADDNLQMCDLLRLQFETMEDMELVTCAHNGEDALLLIGKHCPDVVLLDLIMPRLDGVGVLERLSSLEKKPEIIVITALGNEEIMEEIAQYGVRNYIIKPVNIEQIKSRIHKIMDNRSRPANMRGGLSAAHSKGALSPDEEITRIFLAIGIPAHIKGYQFLREAVKMVMDDQDIINNITKQLYPGVAQRFSSTPGNVERAIRHAIGVAWNRGHIEKIYQMLGHPIYRKDKPTNGEFIALVADGLLVKNSA